MQTEKLTKGAEIHTAFDDYVLIRQQGEGGNGKVFSAKNSDGEEVAIKFVEKNSSRTKLKRFKNEIYFCEQHRHKNIVPILDRGYVCFDEKEYVFYIMPLYNETLKDRIKKGVSHKDAVHIFVGILEGLNFAHEHNTIHRDIKPENILFSAETMDPVICDFGIAHFTEDELLTAVETRPGDRMANFYYAAPEQYKKKAEICPQTDIYSAALILNEMFTGEIPQATGYKTIKEIDPDYGYLDDVFVQLFRQVPEERLYPEDQIISEMKILAERNRREKEKAILQNAIYEMIDPGKFETNIIRKEYRNGYLVFIFDREFPVEWFQKLAYSSYSHSAIMGYEPDKLRMIGTRELDMRLRSNINENTLKSIIKNVEEWVRTVNEIYNREQKQLAYANQQRKEQERIEKLEKIEKENAIASLIAKL